MNPIIEFVRLIYFRKNKTCPPEFVSLYPTDMCNLRCRTCWRHERKTYVLEPSLDRELKLYEWINIINQLKDYGVKGIQLCGGGEPFLRKDIIKIMSHIRKRKLRSHIVTNGTLITESISKNISKFGWDSFTFSIDGDKYQHDKNRGKGKFERSIKGIEKIRKYNEIPIHFETVITKYNESDLTKIVNIAKEMDIKSIRFLVEYSFKGKHRKLKIKKLIEAGKLAKELKIPTNALGIVRSMKKDYTQKLKPRGCNLMWASCIIMAQGDVVPCCFTPNLILGNLIKDEFKNIWENKKSDSFRKKSRYQCLPKECLDCEPLTLMHQNNLMDFYDFRSIYPIKMPFKGGEILC